MPSGRSPVNIPTPTPGHDGLRDERDDAFALVAHELRNPLHALTLQLALARTTAQTHGETASVAHIAKAQRLLARYSERVTMLLDLVTLQPNALPVKRRPVDLGELLRGLADSLLQEATFRSVTIHTDAPRGVLAHTDPVLLEQVVDNLLLNAFKHAGCRQVTLSLREEAAPTGPQALIAVTDDGRGIALDDQERIFGKFGIAAASHRGTGTGLGLWIVRKLLDALGGTLSLRSSPGAGATFTVALPLTERPKGAP